MRARLILATIFFGGMVFVPTTRAQITVLDENFDGVTPPGAPVGWLLTGSWETSDGSASSGSGLNNLMVSGSDSSTADSPELDLSGALEATLTYLGRRSGSFDPMNLRVTASVDGGNTFPVTLLSAGTALPVTDSKYEEISIPLPSSLIGEEHVVLRFETLGTSSSAANARLDDVTIMMSIFDPSASGGILAFSSLESFPEDSATIEVPISLEFIADEGLQGLQFRVSWGDAPLNPIDVVPGIAVADSTVWSISHQADEESVKVVMLGHGTTALASGTYAPLLTLLFAPGLTTSASLHLSDVIGSLATPEGLDARIIASGLSHTISFASDAASFDPSVLSLDLGDVEVGASDSTIVSVTNSTGTIDLQITNVVSTNPLFVAAPTSAVIAPGFSQDFVVRFSPTTTQFGRQNADLIFSHNADTGSSAIELTARGLGGRGDAEGDGMVDVMDVVHAIDFVLDRIIPGPVQLAATDLYPFPDGDLAIDVRDLTVLSQAVALGMWPDEVHLPLEESVVEGEGNARIVMNGGNGSVIEVEHDVPIRAFQLVFPSDTYDSSRVRIDGMHIVTGYDDDRKELRVLAYVAGGGSLEAGTRTLFFAEELGAPRYVAVIGEDRERLTIETVVPLAAETPSIPDEIQIRPYPNPFRPGTESLHFGVRTRVSIFDILGRKVYSAEDADTWDGRAASGQIVAPGLYLLKLYVDEDPSTRLVTVVR